MCAGVAFCLGGAYSPASADRLQLHIQSLPDHAVWRGLSTTNERGGLAPPPSIKKSFRYHSKLFLKQEGCSPAP